MRRPNGPGPLVPSFIQPFFDSVDTAALPGGVCPRLESQDGLVLRLDHAYHSFRLCRCLDGFYNVSGTCVPCPANARCIGFPSSNTQESDRLVPISGYFPIVSITPTNLSIYQTADEDVLARVSAERTNARSAGNGSASETTLVVRNLVACEYGQMRASSPANPCIGAASGFFCREGHSGRLCSLCKDQYFLRDGLCVPCKRSEGIYPTLFVITLLLIFSVSVGLVVCHPVLLKRSEPAAGGAKNKNNSGAAASTKKTKADLTIDATSCSTSGVSSRDWSTTADEATSTVTTITSCSSSAYSSEQQEHEAPKPSGRFAQIVQTALFREYIAYFGSILTLAVSFSQIVSITLADLRVPTEVLGVFQILRFFESRPDTAGYGVGAYNIDQIDPARMCSAS